MISGRTARRILDAQPGILDASFDLGRSHADVAVEAGCLVLPDGGRLPLDALAEGFSSPEDCIELFGGGCRKLYAFDEARASYYKLFQPVEDRAPTIIINGAAMHAIVGKEPWQDAADKVAEVPAAGGECLDTCGGLGYSAQLLADAGFARVVSCEPDPNVLSMAAVNPWSEGWFTRPAIELLSADVREVLAGAPAGRFACVFHDPPTLHVAGELYGEALYSSFARVLRPGGVLYHYTGSPGGRGGRDFVRGVVRRMEKAGFRQVHRVTSGALGMRGR